MTEPDEHELLRQERRWHQDQAIAARLGTRTVGHRRGGSLARVRMLRGAYRPIWRFVRGPFKTKGRAFGQARMMRDAALSNGRLRKLRVLVVPHKKGFPFWVVERVPATERKSSQDVVRKLDRLNGTFAVLRTLEAKRREARKRLLKKGKV